MTTGFYRGSRAGRRRPRREGLPPLELSRFGSDASKTVHARHDQIELAYREICQMRGLPLREERD